MTKNKPLSQSLYGFRELEHTADWVLEVWASDLAGLFEQAARGMYALAKVRLADVPRLKRELHLTAYDNEVLLVDFLSELLYIAEDENLAFDSFKIKLNENNLDAILEGAPIVFQAKEIKAVTFHGLAIEKDEKRGVFTVKIVFDV